MKLKRNDVGKIEKQAKAGCAVPAHVVVNLCKEVVALRRHISDMLRLQIGLSKEEAEKLEVFYEQHKD